VGNNTVLTSATQIVGTSKPKTSVGSLPVYLPLGGHDALPIIINREMPERAWDLRRAPSKGMPECVQLEMLHKLGLFLDQTSVPLDAPAEFEIPLDKKYTAAVLAMEDWMDFTKTLPINPVFLHVDLALGKFAAAGDLDGFWRLRHTFMNCLYGGW
jgi:hypothetical protein